MILKILKYKIIKEKIKFLIKFKFILVLGIINQN
jgi:hypothetical protein